MEKLTLAVLATKLVGLLGQPSELRRRLVLFQPETVLRWHRNLVRRKWACAVARGGPIAADCRPRTLILRLAAEDGRWGYSRIHGELHKLDYDISRSAVCDVLKRHHVAPTPQRGRPGDSC